MERIVSHHKRAKSITYHIQWYGYHSRDDTLGLPDHIPQNLIESYWPRMKRKMNPYQCYTLRSLKAKCPAKRRQAAAVLYMMKTGH